MADNNGIGYCGLPCFLCKDRENCVGCKNDGCKDKEWCKNLKCCKEKGLNGCWECETFPCMDTLLKDNRIRTFAKFIGIYGEAKLTECLERNDKAGIIFNYADKYVGDYDTVTSEEDIINLILNGRN